MQRGGGCRPVAVFVSIVFISSWIRGQDPVHRRYTVADGLPSNTIYCAIQDRDGFMWFGTDAGVARFDGHTFRNYGVRHGLTDNSVIKLAQDSKGRIWFLTLNGRLCYWLNDTVHNGSTDGKLSRYESRNGWSSFVEDRNGMLWFGGLYDDVLRLDMEGDHDSLWIWPGSKPSVVLDTDGELVMVVSGTIRKAKEGHWVTTDSLPRGTIVQRSIERGRDGRSPATLVYTRSILALEDGHWRPFVPTTTVDVDRYVVCWIDAVGDLWATRADRGVDHYAKTPAGFAPVKDLFARELVNYECVDHELGRWICTARRGLIYCTTDQFHSAVFNGAEEEEEGMLVLLRQRDGHVLVGSAEDKLYSYNGEALVKLPIDSMGRVVDLAEDPLGNIWVAADRKTLIITPEGGVEDVAVKPSGSSERIVRRHGAKAVELLPDGSVWFTNFSLFKVERRGAQYVRIGVPDSINFSGRTLVPHVDARGRFWFEANDRLLCIENGRLREIPGLEGRTGLRITDIKSLDSGQLLVGTAGAGVLVLDEEARPLGSITTGDGLRSDDISRIRVFHDTLLIATEHGLSVVIGDLLAPDRRSIFSVRGLASNEVHDAITDGDRLLLATSAGLCSVPFPRKVDVAPPPLMLLAGVWLNGNKVSADKRLELMEGRDLVRIVFRAIAFADADRVEYQYRLRPHDAWSKVKDGMLELASLSHGPYAVAMRARRPDSAWSEPEVVRLVVNAPWWMRGSTWIFGFLVIGLLLVLVTRRSVRGKYRLALAELRQREVVNKERSRIAADIHDDLGADLSRLLHYARRVEPGTEKMTDRPLTQGLDQAIDKMDEIIWALDPRRDTLQSTVQFIEQQAREVAETNDLKFRADVRVPRSPIPLAAAYRRELMLLAREAIRNIIDHAGASTIWVEWRADKGVVELMIGDDGKGFDPASVDPTRHGLHNMRQRAVHLEGTLRIEKRNASGTNVYLRFPLAGIIRSDDAIEEEDTELGP